MDFLKETDRGGINIRHAIDEQPDSNGFYFHIHDRCELFYFISGNAQYLVEGSVYPLEHGQPADNATGRGALYSLSKCRAI